MSVSWHENSAWSWGESWGCYSFNLRIYRLAASNFVFLSRRVGGDQGFVLVFAFIGMLPPTFCCSPFVADLSTCQAWCHSFLSMSFTLFHSNKTWQNKSRFLLIKNPGWPVKPGRASNPIMQSSGQVASPCTELPELSWSLASNKPNRPSNRRLRSISGIITHRRWGRVYSTSRTTMTSIGCLWMQMPHWQRSQTASLPASRLTEQFQSHLTHFSPAAHWHFRNTKWDVC